MNNSTEATTTASQWSLGIQGSIDVPDRTAYIDDPDFTDQEFTVTGVARFSPGADLEVNSEAPSGTDYQLELLNRNMNTEAASSVLTGDATYTFDTTGLEPGTYGVVSIKDGTVQAVYPVVLRAYLVDITVGPSSLKTGDDLGVRAELTDLGSGESINKVRLLLMSKEGDTGGERTMTETSTNTYEGTIPDLVEGEFVYGVVVQGNQTVDLGVDGTSFIDDNFNEAIGHSDVRDLSVTLSDADKLKQKWTDDRLKRLQFSTAALNNDNVYVAGLDETLEALTRNTGSQEWEFVRSGSLSDSSPLLESGVVYIGSGGGKFYGIDAGSGSQEWVADVGSAVTSTPVVMNDTVYFGTNDGQVHAVDIPRIGSVTPKWSTSVGGPVYSTLAAGGGKIYLTTDDGDVVALNPDGSESWRFDEGAEFGASSPRYADGSVYVAGTAVYRLDPASGAVQWQQSSYTGTAGSTPTLTNGVVFVGGSDGTMYALNDTDSGATLWTAPAGDAIPTTPAIVDDRVVVGSLDGKVYVFDRSTGSEVWTASLGAPIRSSPVERNDEVYIGTEDSTFYVLQNVP